MEYGQSSTTRGWKSHSARINEFCDRVLKVTSVPSQRHILIVMSTLPASALPATQSPPAIEVRISEDEETPSKALLELMGSLTLEPCRALIQTQLVPLIDTLPPAESAAIVAAFSAAAKAERNREKLLGHLDFEEHNESLRATAEARAKHPTQLARRLPRARSHDDENC